MRFWHHITVSHCYIFRYNVNVHTFVHGTVTADCLLSQPLCMSVCQRVLLFLYIYCNFTHLMLGCSRTISCNYPHSKHAWISHTSLLHSSWVHVMNFDLKISLSGSILKREWSMELRHRYIQMKRWRWLLHTDFFPIYFSCLLDSNLYVWSFVLETNGWM